MSVEWNVANFGVTREQLGEWRKRALVFKKTAEKKQKKLQEDEKAKNEIYSKNLKSRKLPNITEATWSIALWKTEEGNYSTQEAKLSVIRDRLENQTDKSCTEAMSTLEEVMSYLFKRYGSPNAIMSDNLDSLEQLGTPATDEKLEEHCVKICAMLTICDKDDELSSLWTSARMGRVVNKCLSEQIRNYFWERYEPFKQECYRKWVEDDGIDTPLDTWEATYDKLYSSQRITYLITFLELRISILRNMGV